MLSSVIVFVVFHVYHVVLFTYLLSQIAQLDREKHEVVSQLNEVRHRHLPRFHRLVTQISARSF